MEEQTTRARARTSASSFFELKMFCFAFAIGISSPPRTSEHVTLNQKTELIKKEKKSDWRF